MVVGQMCNQWRQREVYVLAVIWMQRQQALLEMVVDGAEGKGAIKQGTQVFILTTGKVVLPFIEHEITGEGMDSGLGTIISCLDCQNSILNGVYLLAYSQQFILEKFLFLSKLIQKKRKFLTDQKLRELFSVLS